MILTTPVLLDCGHSACIYCSHDTCEKCGASVYTRVPNVMVQSIADLYRAEAGVEDGGDSSGGEEEC
ncbi:hypothetical protein, partial [Salmonella enterica]|uniref:hypothetical protein n=1 Tax=Salmonella enterica TaxID=28901 RepID=UPI0019D5BE17